MKTKVSIIDWKIIVNNYAGNHTGDSQKEYDLKEFLEDTFPVIVSPNREELIHSISWNVYQDLNRDYFCIDCTEEEEEKVLRKCKEVDDNIILLDEQYWRKPDRNLAFRLERFTV